MGEPSKDVTITRNPICYKPCVVSRMHSDERLKVQLLSTSVSPVCPAVCPNVLMSLCPFISLRPLPLNSYSIFDTVFVSQPTHNVFFVKMRV